MAKKKVEPRPGVDFAQILPSPTFYDLFPYSQPHPGSSVLVSGMQSLEHSEDYFCVLLFKANSVIFNTEYP